MERTSTNKKKETRTRNVDRTNSKRKMFFDLGSSLFFLICQVHVPNNDAIIKYIDFRVIVLTDGVHCQ